MREQQAAIARSRAGAFARGVGFGRTEADIGAADAARAGREEGSDSDSDSEGDARAGVDEDLHRIGAAWPGPWSTAMAIEGGAEAARERREHKIVVEALTGEERTKRLQRGLAESEDAALRAAWTVAERVLAEGEAGGAEETWGPRKKRGAAGQARGKRQREEEGGAWDEDDAPEGWEATPGGTGKGMGADAGRENGVRRGRVHGARATPPAPSPPPPSREEAAGGHSVGRFADRDAVAFPTLFELASAYMASLVADENFDTEGSLSYLPDEVRRRLARTLAKGRLLDGAALEALAEGSPAELHVEDLTGSTEEGLGRVFSKLAKVDGAQGNGPMQGTAALTALHLGMAGRCLGTRSLACLLPPEAGAARGALLPNLRKLVIQGAYRLEDADVIRVLENAPRLEDLTLEACTRLSGEALRAAARSCTSLTRVSLKGCAQLRDEDVDALNDLPALASVSLHGLKQVSDAGVRALCATAGPRLVSLDLGRCGMVSGQAVGEAVASTCPNLEHLWLDECDTLTNRGAKRLAAGCKGLRTLSLRGCARIGDKGLARLCAANRGLQKLCLGGVRGLTDSGLAAIASHCRSGLVELDLGWCRLLTAKAVAAVAAACPELRQLTLWGNARMDLTFVRGMRALLPRVTLIGLYGRGGIK